MESSPIGIAVVLPAENKRLYVNPAMVHMYGAESVEQMIATEISNSFVNPDEFRRLQAGTGENLIREAVVERKRPDGSTWWCLLSRQPIVFQGKHAMMVWNWDITDRKHAEDALVAKEALTRRLLEASPVGVLIATREGQHLFANARALEIQGVTRDELFSHNAGVYYADPGLRTRMKDDLYATGSTPPTEVELVRPDGSHFIVVLSSTLIEFEGQRAHITYLYDISELKQTEQALRESRERTRAIVDNIIDGIVTIDAAGTILTINSKAAEIFGYAEHEMVGHNVDILMPEPHRGSRDRYAANYRTTGVAKFLGETRQIEGVRRDGRRFPMELAINAVPFGDERLFVGIVRDVTEQKEMERLKGEFVSTVSHELRTPLTSIRGSLGLLTGGVVGKLPAKARAMIEMAEKNTERLINLVNDILDMEKLESGRMEFRFTRLDLGRLVEAGITANKGYADGFGVEFVLTGNDPDIFVRADNDRLTQVLTNLLSNAAKFSPKGGKVEVAVGSRKGWGCVSVRDHGPGIPDEFRDKIFGKFTQADSSDKRTAGGTGLGLNISKTIIEKHGGVIGFESGSGDGATFYFEVPAWRELPVKLGDPRMREGSRVLICEDDEDIAELLSLMLGRQGIISDIARTAGQARGLLAANAYDAMTLDLILPDQDGLSFIRDLRADARTRNLPVVVVSVLADEGRKAV
ncbi:MAG TPA: PAS domain S-box protein, partial [Rhodospirillales bacterium]